MFDDYTRHGLPWMMGDAAMDSYFAQLHEQHAEAMSIPQDLSLAAFRMAWREHNDWRLLENRYIELLSLIRRAFEAGQRAA